MASFTDTISQFNPYIKQLPVEAMTQVGMYKQQKYDEGVQKIQGYVDNIAGLDVYKDIDKVYLQSKLNELGSKLKTVAAGDFSNQQLVNSVGGMATQIVKDPIIQEAVTSTKWIRKGEEELEQARKAGKNSIQNESWWREHEVGSWLNDGKVGSAFRGRYTEYTDMEKKLRDVAKEVHEYDNSIESPFMRDNLGRTLYFYKNAKGEEVATLDPTKGTNKIDAAILKTKVKGKSAQKILDNFYMSLDENDKKQLGIDGWYHYKGVSGDQLKAKVKNDIVSTFEMKKKNISDEIVKLTVELASNENLTSDQKTLIRTQLNNYQKLSKGGGLDKMLQQSIASVDTTDEMSLKQSVYTEKFLEGLASNIAYQDMETEYKTNPYQVQLMAAKDLEFKYWNAQRDQRNKDREYGLDVTRLQMEQVKANREEAEFYKKITGDPYIWKNLGVDAENKALPTLATLDKDISQVNSDMRAYAMANLNMLPNKNGLTADQAMAAFDKLVDEYTKNPKPSDDPEKLRVLNEYRNMRVDLLRRISNRDFISQESEKRFGKNFENLLKDESGINDRNGRQLYSAAELSSVGLNLQQFVKYVTPSVSGSPSTGVAQTKMVVDKEGIINKYKDTKYAPIAQAYAKKMSGESLTPTEQGLMKRVTEINDNMKKATQALQKQKLAFESEKIGEMMPQFQQVATTLNMEDKDTQRAVESAIGNMYAFYERFGSSESERFNPNTVTSWRTGKEAKDLKYIIKKSADGSGGALVIMKGDEIQEVPLGSELGAYFPKAVATNPMENIKVMIQSSPTKTTNVLGDISGSPDAAVNAAFTGEMLPLLANTSFAPIVRFDVQGSKVNNGGDDDKFLLRMYVNHNGVWKSDIVNKEGFATYSGIMEMLKNIGTNELSRIINLR
jgi:hypothetical protein